MPASAVPKKKYSPEVLHEAVQLFGHIGYTEDFFEDVYRVACGGAELAPTKADGVSLAMTAFTDTARRETDWLIGRRDAAPQRIWETLSRLSEAWPAARTRGLSSVLEVLADDQHSCPVVVEEAQAVVSHWAELLAGQLHRIPAMENWREARVGLLASELVGALVSGYRLSVTYRNHIHFHRVLEHWRHQLVFYSSSRAASS
jgi:hypothetical protein